MNCNIAHEWMPEQAAIFQLYLAQQMQGFPFMVGPQQFPMPMGNSVPQHFGDEDSYSDNSDDEEKRTLFIANLDERVTEELLFESFIHAGPIESVRIPKDNAGKQRKFGFVIYVHQCTAPYAMQLMQGLQLYRRTITIKFQGSEQIPINPRRSLPADLYGNAGGNMCGNNFNVKNHHSFDNSALRSANFPTFAEMGPSTSFGKVDNGSHNSERVARHGRSSRHNDTPYQRNADNQRHDRHREREWSRSRHHHKDGNRHANQRSGRNRR